LSWIEIVGEEEMKMQWLELAVVSAIVLCGAPLASVRAAPPLDALHDGWYFTGSEARTKGIAARTAVAIDCNGATPRIILDFRAAAPSLGTPEPTATTATRVTLSFVKHSVLGSLTSMFNQKEQRVLTAKLLSRGGREGPDSLERIVIDGADAVAIATKLKSVDEFTAEDDDLGRSVSFKMTDAKAAIDQVFSRCSSEH
jgi:hypothetical protein